MDIKVKVLGTDRDVANAARTTISLEDTDKPVSPAYMRKMYLSEHSPIRLKMFEVTVTDVPYWIAMHFVRHKIGIEHFVTTQREDRTGEDRGIKPQDALVTWKFVANAAAIIAISRKRLCNQAHKDTMRVWIQILRELEWYDAALARVCVPDCVYRGWCYEYKSCNYHKSRKFLLRLQDYREGINKSEPILASPMDRSLHPLINDGQQTQMPELPAGGVATAAVRIQANAEKMAQAGESLKRSMQKEMSRCFKQGM